ncbi:MAG: radical SAM family heme chaperone HemW [Gemmatimonadaceae bacterium]
MRHLYLHVPFCSRRCSYCDFAIDVRRGVPVADYIGGVRKEMEMRHPPRDGWILDSLYLGGGTPSRLGAGGIARLVDLVRSHAALSAAAEVTIEANPEDVSREAVRGWRDAGVNRISLGVQSFDDRALQWMHRVHTAEQTRRAVEAARAAGIESLSLDLIFALPALLARDWDRDLAEALALEPDHLALYGLTVEPGTPLGRWTARREVTEAPEEVYEQEFLRAHEAATAAGLEHYEVSNFGRPGRHALHNAAYWSGVAYGGVGPAAHEYDGAQRRWNVASYEAWRRTLDEGLDPVAGSETLNAANREAEQVYLGLRTIGGLEVRGGDAPLVSQWEEAGWGSVNGRRRLVLTPLGWLRLDALAAALTYARSRC